MFFFSFFHLCMLWNRSQHCKRCPFRTSWVTASFLSYIMVTARSEGTVMFSATTLCWMVSVIAQPKQYIHTAFWPAFVSQMWPYKDARASVEVVMCRLPLLADNGYGGCCNTPSTSGWHDRQVSNSPHRSAMQQLESSPFLVFPLICMCLSWWAWTPPSPLFHL